MMTEAPDFSGEMKSCAGCGRKRKDCEAQAYIEAGRTTFKPMCPDCNGGVW